jgi:hypothetical protein
VLKYYRRWVDPERYLGRWLDPRLGTLRVADIRDYLLRRGWTLVPADLPYTLVFQEPPGADEEPFYQFVPDSEDSPDFVRRLVELITLLAFFEDRHPVQVINDIIQQASPEQTNGAAQTQLHEANAISK